MKKILRKFRWFRAFEVWNMQRYWDKVFGDPVPFREWIPMYKNYYSRKNL